jgi:cob(I)alamin adenosyltransferase
MVYLSRITTKSGDQGETGLGDGTRVSKDHPRIVACGEVDELNSVIGLLIASCPAGPETELLTTIQNDLFDVGADLCTPMSPSPQPALRVTEQQIQRLEASIDRLNQTLPALTSFVLPGGTPLAAWIHVARAVCRRAERAVVTLKTTEDGNKNVLIYLNRLSDLLFVLARTANAKSQKEVLWVPAKFQ